MFKVTLKKMAMDCILLPAAVAHVAVCRWHYGMVYNDKEEEKDGADYKDLLWVFALLS